MVVGAAVDCWRQSVTMVKLTAEQLKSYEENGFIIIDVLTEAEIEEVSNEYDVVFKRKADYNLESTWGGSWMKSNDKDGLTTKSIHGMQMHSAVFTRLLLNENVLDACESIMKTPNILLHHTKAHNKPPGRGSPFPMHQDYPYMPYKNDSMIALFFNLDDSSPANGGLCVYPGSHKLGPLEDVSDDPNFHYLDKEKFSLENATPVIMKKGQVLIFSYLLIHGSYHNTSERVRRMFLVQIVAAEDEPLNNMHQSAAQGLVLRGCNPGRDANIANRSSGQ